MRTTPHIISSDGANWVWLLPVRARHAGRMISVGLTYRPDLFGDPMTSVPEFLDRMTREHPILADFVRSGRVVDTNLYRNYMYRARRRYSSRGWFLIGDAADTVDPLYSTGLALVAAAIQQVGVMIRCDLDGRLTDGFAADLDEAYAGLQRLAEEQVARLYGVMEEGYQCRLRMHLQVVTFFRMAMPLLLNGYHTDAVGAAMMARLGRPGHGAGAAVDRLRAPHRQSGCTTTRANSLRGRQGAVDLRDEQLLVRAVP